ncbi:MAG: GNAT family N-acetyltransferase [Bacteroidota bacterium]
MADFLTVPLSRQHQRAAFRCGHPQLDTYLHRQARQDVKRKISACFVSVTPEGEIKGYYTLSNASIPYAWIPEPIRKRLPPAYTDLPVTLLGRLAISRDHQGQGLGKLLLLDALKRSYLVSRSVASLAVIVDPIDEAAIRFYQRYQFQLLPDSGKMFLPMKTIEPLFTDP